MNAWPYFAEDEIQAAADVLRSGKVNYWTGQVGREFEKAFAKYHDCEYGIALANGTVALELALYALDIGPGDEVITTPRTFIASASAIVMRGATPVLADVDLESQNITAETIARVITPKTKAIIAVHLAGWPCDMDPIMELARKHNLYVIEDCAQAHGAKYKDRHVGSLGHIAAFSFCQDKIMTTGGEGGILTTNDKTLWQKAWAFKDHGKDYDTVYHKEHPPGFRWLHNSFGTNWRLTEMQSAIGLKQLEKLDEWLAIRKKLAQVYDQVFVSVPALHVPLRSNEIEHANYKYYAFVRPEQLKEGWDRDRLLTTLNERGCVCFSGSCSEIYLEKAFTDSQLKLSKRLANAKLLGETSLMFLIHPTLSEQDILNNANLVLNAMEEASKCDILV